MKKRAYALSIIFFCSHNTYAQAPDKQANLDGTEYVSQSKKDQYTKILLASLKLSAGILATTSSMGLTALALWAGLTDSFRGYIKAFTSPQSLKDPAGLLVFHAFHTSWLYTSLYTAAHGYKELKLALCASQERQADEPKKEPVHACDQPDNSLTTSSHEAPDDLPEKADK